jgi:hypothetical protein
MYITSKEISGGFLLGLNSTTPVMMMNHNFTTEEMVHASTVYPYELWQKILFSCFMFPIIFFSIVGNIIVVTAIAKYSYLRVTNNIFLASLAVADCAVGILAMVPNALQLLSGHWYLKAFMCRFWFACDVLFSTASILHLCCVSFDRYLSVSDAYTFVYLSEHPTKSWRVRVMIGAVWITSALLSFVPIFTDMFTTSEHVKRINSLDYEDGQCAFVVNMPYRFLSSTVSFWLPGILMVIFYSLVMRKAYNLENGEFKKYKNVHHNASFDRRATRTATMTNADSNNLLNQVGKRNSHDVAKSWKREYSLIKTLGFVITLFCLCWIFFFLRYTLCGPTHSICPEVISHNLVLEDILFWIGYCNSALNPFLYNFTNQDFQKAFRNLLRLKRSTHSFNHNNGDGRPTTRHLCCFRFKRKTRLESMASQNSASRKTTIDEARQFLKA